MVHVGRALLQGLRRDPQACSLLLLAQSQDGGVLPLPMLVECKGIRNWLQRYHPEVRPAWLGHLRCSFHFWGHACLPCKAAACNRQGSQVTMPSGTMN